MLLYLQCISTNEYLHTKRASHLLTAKHCRECNRHPSIHTVWLHGLACRTNQSGLRIDGLIFLLPTAVCFFYLLPAAWLFCCVLSVFPAHVMALWAASGDLQLAYLNNLPHRPVFNSTLTWTLCGTGMPVMRWIWWM